MKHDLELLKTIRGLAGKATAGLSPEALAQVPPGYNNSVLWNVGHILVTQQILCYQLSGLPPAVDDATLGMFRNGSSPAQWGAAPRLESLLEQLRNTAVKLARDYEQGLFESFSPYTTSTGFHLASIEDAIAFNNFHEGVHLGYILALRHLVG